MTTTSPSVDATGGEPSGGKGWGLLLAAGLAVSAAVLSSLAITEVTRALSLVVARSNGTAGEFVLTDCRTHADGLDPRPDHVTCDGLFSGEDGFRMEDVAVTVKRPPADDPDRPVAGWRDGFRGWGDDLSAPSAVATAVVVLLLALAGWAGAIRAYRMSRGGRRKRPAG